MAYFLGLLFALTSFWLANSGYYKPAMIGFMTGSLILTLILAYRLELFDREGSPYVRVIQFLGYIPWLALEVVKANWTVIRACLRADLDICPTLVKIRTTCRSDLARVTFANSITLTPGTVTIDIDGDKLLVHGLYEANTTPEGFTEMDRRCARAGDAEGAAA